MLLNLLAGPVAGPVQFCPQPTLVWQLACSQWGELPVASRHRTEV